MTTNIAEQRLITALRAMVIETMAYPPVRPYDSESHCPDRLIADAQDALDAYGMRVPHNVAMMANRAAQ